MANRPIDMDDASFNELYERYVEPLNAETIFHEPRHNKRATAFGNEILMLSDLRIEKWPTIRAARARLAELAKRGYVTGVAPAGDFIHFAERHVCAQETMQ